MRTDLCGVLVFAHGDQRVQMLPHHVKQRPLQALGRTGTLQSSNMSLEFGFTTRAASDEGLEGWRLTCTAQRCATRRNTLQALKRVDHGSDAVKPPAKHTSPERLRMT